MLPDPPATSFASDNAAGVLPEILDAIQRSNAGSALAYGSDAVTRDAKQRICELFGAEVESYFTFNGTGANVLALAALLEVGDAVLCVDTAHIHTDEASAPERVLSTKLVTVPGKDGKLSPDAVQNCVSDHLEMHHPRIGVVSISQVTEMGTLYTVEEIRQLSDAAHSCGLKLHLDGARIANAVAALGCDVSTLRAMTIDAGVDAISFGTTKNGGMFGEAVVLFSPTSKKSIDHLRKQLTQLPSKMRFVSAQFAAHLQDDLWLKSARHANEMTQMLYSELKNVDTLKLAPPAANSLFPTLSPDVAKKLTEWSFFWEWRRDANQYRWMTSWQTSKDDVHRFADGVRTVLQSR